MNSYQAKKIPIQDLLSRLGYAPVRKDKGGEEWVYNSPFREEDIPSFFVNIRKNVWNDFGDIGGNILDFVMRHENKNLSGALAFMDSLYPQTGFKPHRATKTEISIEPSVQGEKFILDGVMPLKSRVLENYLRDRSINIDIARQYLQVVQFHHAKTNKSYFAFGWQNERGDYEVRNQKLKAVVGNKGISFIKGKNREEGAKNIAVFEGCLDFLSYLTEKNQSHLESDVLILNSAKLAERAKDFIRQKDYQKVYTFFDNDRAGEETQQSFAELKNQIVSCNHLYQDFKDYNDYWQTQCFKSKSASR